MDYANLVGLNYIGILTKLITTGSLTASLVFGQFQIPIAQAPLYDHEGAEIQAILEKLIWCESRGVKTAYNSDDGGSPSYSILQFKLATFNFYGEKYDLPHDDIWNPEQQLAIARAMLKDGHWRAWYNCLRKYYE